MTTASSIQTANLAGKRAIVSAHVGVVRRAPPSAVAGREGVRAGRGFR